LNPSLFRALWPSWKAARTWFLGYLIFRSTFLPRILGAPIALAGVGWLIFLASPIANALLAYLEVLGFVTEAALMLWLLLFGVNGQRWAEINSGEVNKHG